MPDGAIGIQSAGAIVLTAGELTDDMILMQIVTAGAPLTGMTLGALKAYINSDTGLYDDGGVLGITDPSTWPQDSSGIPGSLWSNGGVASVVPGGVPISAPPVYFGLIFARNLLALGGLGLPTTNPTPGSLQLWTLNGEILIA